MKIMDSNYCQQPMEAEKNIAASENKRPTAVTVACIVSWVFLILTMLSSILYSKELSMSKNEVKFALFTSLYGLYAFSEIWKMEKTGVYNLAGLAVLDIILSSLIFAELAWANAFVSFIVYAILLIVPLIYFKKMK